MPTGHWLKLYPELNPNPKIPPPPKEELQEKYIGQKLSTWELAREYGYSQRLIRRWLIEYGIPRRSHKENKMPVKKGGNHTWGHKISASQKGKCYAGKGAEHPRWKGGRPSCKHCKKPFKTYHPKTGLCIKCLGKTPERRKQISDTSPHKGKPAWNRGKSNWWLKDELNNHWKGGITPIHEMIRRSFKYKVWRKAVLKRDGYKCINCGSSKKGTLQADHIKPFCLYPELRLDVDNGRTLCRECHIAIGWQICREGKDSGLYNP